MMASLWEGIVRAVGIDFEWDSSKAARNLRKHGVTFEEAARYSGTISA